MVELWTVETVPLPRLPPRPKRKWAWWQSWFTRALDDRPPWRLWRPVCLGVYLDARAAEVEAAVRGLEEYWLTSAAQPVALKLAKR